MNEFKLSLFYLQTSRTKGSVHREEDSYFIKSNLSALSGRGPGWVDCHNWFGSSHEVNNRVHKGEFY